MGEQIFCYAVIYTVLRKQLSYLHGFPLFICGVQMKFLRHLLGITKLDKEKNQCIRQNRGAQNTVKEIKQYQKKWLEHVQRMDTNRLPKQALQYKPKG